MNITKPESITSNTVISLFSTIIFAAPGPLSNTQYANGTPFLFALAGVGCTFDAVAFKVYVRQ